MTTEEIKKELEGKEITSDMLHELVYVANGKAIVQGLEVNLTDEGWRKLYEEWKGNKS